MLDENELEIELEIVPTESQMERLRRIVTEYQAIGERLDLLIKKHEQRRKRD